MNENFFFREATSADHLEIECLFKKIRLQFLNPAQFNWPDDQIQQELMKSHFYLSWGLSHGIYAFIAYRVNGDWVEIMALGTDPDFSKRGIMQALLNDFVQKYSKQGLQVALEVHELNQAAISLYEKCGFKLVRIRKSYYKDGGAALVMATSS